MRRTALILLIVACAAGGLYFYRLQAPKPTLQSFRTVAVQRGKLVSKIKATGTIEPQDVVDVGAQVMGRIKDLGVDLNAEKIRAPINAQTSRESIYALSHLDVGQPVGHLCSDGASHHSGQSLTLDDDHQAGGDDRPRIDYNSIVHIGTELAYIDATRYEAQYAQTKAALEKANADLEQLEAKAALAAAELRRAEKLRNIQRTSNPVTHVPVVAISESDYDMAVANDKVAKANMFIGKAVVEQNCAACDLAKSDLDYTIIKSPVEGVILERRVNIGQTVVAALNAPSLFLIALDLSRLQVWASVNEADIGRIRKGMNVTFTVDAYPHDSFSGCVKQVRLNAQMTQNVVTYTVVVDTENPDGKLLPYMTANMQFEVDTRSDVLLVPNTALRWTPETSQIDPSVGEVAPIADDSSSAEEIGRVWVTANDGFVRPIDVTIGESDATVTEISGPGVFEGMQVVAGEQGANGERVEDGETSTNPFLPKPPKGSRPPPPM